MFTRTARFFAFVLLALTLLLPASSATPVQAITPTAAWIDIQASGGTVYLLYDSPPLVKRYNMNTRAWLADIELTGHPAAFCMDAEHLYIAYTSLYSYYSYSVDRYALDGTNETHLFTSVDSIRALMVVNQFLIMQNHSLMGDSEYFQSIDKESGVILSTINNPSGDLYNLSISPAAGKIFGVDDYVAARSLTKVSFTSAGVFSSIKNYPMDDYYDYHKEYLIDTWTSPNGSLVLGNNGFAFSTTDLSYQYSFLQPINDLAYDEDRPVVLYDGTLYAYSNRVIQTGSYKPATTPQRIFILNGVIFGFSYYDIVVSATPVSLLVDNTQTGEPVDPAATNYLPDQVLVGNDEIVYLRSYEHQSIFRWDAVGRRYLPTIPLIGVPYGMAYTSANNRLYIIHEKGLVTYIQLNQSLVEHPFINIPANCCEIVGVGTNLVLAFDNKFISYLPTGEMIKTIENTGSSVYSMIWNPAKQRVYFARGEGPAYLEVHPDGSFGAIKFNIQTLDNMAEIQVSRDGSRIVSGEGTIYDGNTLDLLMDTYALIPNAAWIGNQLFSVEALPYGDSNQSNLQKWNMKTYEVSMSKQYRDTFPLKMVSIKEGLLLITTSSNRVQFSIWNQYLQRLYPEIFYAYIPSIGKKHSVKPGYYPFSNQCDTADYYRDGYFFGNVLECVTSVQVNADGTMRFDFTWKLDIRPGIDISVTKYPQTNNHYTYLRDNNGDLYEFLACGGVAADGVYGVMDNVVYKGWFLFPPPSLGNATSFTYKDIEIGIEIGPLNLPANP